jgi:glycolate oxidase FAD binding subunit
LGWRAAAAGGGAPVIGGAGGRGDTTIPAPAIQRRLKDAFDPAGILAPGRFWGGI